MVTGANILKSDVSYDEIIDMSFVESVRRTSDHAKVATSICGIGSDTNV